MSDQSENEKATTGGSLMDKLVSLCKRRGFIFQSSEIYGGINGCWDYGPLGVELKRNLKEAWWEDNVRKREDMAGLDSSIIMNPKVWEASGHVGGFADPMCTCRQCKKHFRADQVPDQLAESEWVKEVAPFNPPIEAAAVEVDAGRLMKWAQGKGRSKAPGLYLVRSPAAAMAAVSEHLNQPGRQGKTLAVSELLQLIGADPAQAPGHHLPCPSCGGDLTPPRQFNLMFKTYVGAMEDSSSIAYLRPETAQGIFANYKNVLDTTRLKIPFGIAQIGKSFRNEINPRNYTFRSREFEQMEIEFFCHPKEADEQYKYWRETRYQWYLGLGLRSSKLRLRDHRPEELAHYARACADIEYEFPFGLSELEGIANRTDYDLTQHQKFSGKDMQYFNDETKERFIPYVIEPSGGVDRAALAFLCEAYCEDTAPDEQGKAQPRTVLKLHPRLAPVKVAVFPLVKKEGMQQVARRVYEEIKKAGLATFYDEKGAVGRRYRRQDEAGTPFCVTADGQSMEDQTVTIRDRDTLKQERLAADQVLGYVREKISDGH